jgi:hypothetical protein
MVVEREAPMSRLADAVERLDEAVRDCGDDEMRCAATSARCWRP